MTSEKQKQNLDVHPVEVDAEQWYTAADAAKVLSRNSGHKIGPEYPYKLGTLEKVRVKKINPRVLFYHKQDVDAYRVEPRGTRSGAAKRAKAGIAPDQPTVREQRRLAKERKQADQEASRAA